MLVVGHRGASITAPANTLDAFRAAVAEGADGVELDVRRTADGTLAVIHDETLPDGRALLGLSRGDLPPDVPELGEALDACQPLSMVNVEIKNWPDDADFDPTLALADHVVALLSERGDLDTGRILVSCFHLGTLDRVRARAPQVATGWLLGLVEDHQALIDIAVERGHQAVHPHHAFVSEAFVAAAHDAGLSVNTWTCNEPDRIRWLAETGVDALITDTPEEALRALGR